MEWLPVLWSERCSALSSSSWLCGSSLTLWRNISTNRSKQRATRWSEILSSQWCYTSPCLFSFQSTTSTLSLCPLGGVLIRKPQTVFPRQPMPATSMLREMRHTPKNNWSNVIYCEQHVQDVQSWTYVILRCNDRDGAHGHVWTSIWLSVFSFMSTTTLPTISSLFPFLFFSIKLSFFT